MTLETKESSITVIDAKHHVISQTDMAHYSVRRIDWRRLERDLSRCEMAGTSVYDGAGWACVGIATSALFGIVGLAAADADKVPGWVTPTCWAVFIASAVLAVALVLMGKDKRKSAVNTVVAVREEMKNMEAGFYPGEQHRPDPPP